MTDSKLRNSDLAYSICFSQVLFKLFTFLRHNYHIEKYQLTHKFPRNVINICNIFCVTVQLQLIFIIKTQLLCVCVFVCLFVRFVIK